MDKTNHRYYEIKIINKIIAGCDDDDGGGSGNDIIIIVVVVAQSCVVRLSYRYEDFAAVDAAAAESFF